MRKRTIALQFDKQTIQEIFDRDHDCIFCRKFGLAPHDNRIFDCYLESLKKYGQFTYLILKPKACEMFKKTWRECEEVGEIAINGEKAIQLLCFFGSSNYDTTEFSALLNGIIEDCKDLGIETATPDEVAHMMELYRRKDE